MVDNLCYIKPKNKLKEKDKRQKIMNAIKDKIVSISNYQSLKKNGIIEPELIVMVCNCVENSIKKHAGINKKDLVVEILNSIFGGLTTSEIEHINSQCQYNYDNNLIDKIPIVYKAGSILYNYIKSKL